MTDPSLSEFAQFIADIAKTAQRLDDICQAMTLRLNTPPKNEHFPVMIEIPAGKFMMGSAQDEQFYCPSQGPQHEVTLKAFQMSATPITQAQWRAVAALPRVELDLDPDPSVFKGDDRPVENVSWHEAMEFCRRLSRDTGEIYTLPTEAQWEYACRAGTTTHYAFGDTLTPQQANFDGDSTTPVGNYPANAWGLYDMHGNVWEWCLDHWHDDYNGAPTDGSARGMGRSLGKCSGEAPGLTITATVDRLPATGTTRTSATNSSVFASPNARKPLRGGSWYSPARYCRSAFRYNGHPANANLSIGFRVCR